MNGTSRNGLCFYGQCLVGSIFWGLPLFTNFWNGKRVERKIFMRAEYQLFFLYARIWYATGLLFRHDKFIFHTGLTLENFLDEIRMFMYPNIYCVVWLLCI